MDLNTLWFILVTVLFSGFFFLEGFDYGVGILLPFLGKGDTQRRVIINTIGPVWDGNEVWLLTAGGALFAAFPHFYATLFSGFYTALLIILIGLIIRGVAFEFRSLRANVTWRKSWDIAIFIGSFLSALLWGVAVTNLIKGVPIDETMTFTGNFFSLLSVYTLVGGVATFCIFLYHGALFLSLKTEGTLLTKVISIVKKCGIASLVAVVLLAALTYFNTDLYGSILATALIVITAIALIISLFFAFKGAYGKAFIANGVMIISLVAAVFAGLFPRLMVSSTNPEFSLTIYNASSSPYTLGIMSVVALTLCPIIIAYQAWSYRIFKKRVTSKDLHY